MNEASERIEADEHELDLSTDATEAVADAGEPAPDAPTAPVGAQQASADGQAVTEGEILDALKAVLDPELGINIVDLGLVYDVDIAEGHVHVTYTLTTMGCPIGPLVEAQMHQLLDPLPGIDSFDAEMVLRPPWSPEMMSEEAKEALGYF